MDDTSSCQSRASLQGLARQVYTALIFLQQATASLVVSNGKRQFLQKEGVTYTLRYGPSLQHAIRISICQLASLHFSCVECRGNEAADYIPGWRFQSSMLLPPSFRAYKSGILLTMGTWRSFL